MQLFIIISKRLNAVFSTSFSVSWKFWLSLRNNVSPAYARRRWRWLTIELLIMPNSKNFCLRAHVLDRLLSRREGVSVQEALRVINRHLSDKGVPPVTSKDTILKDMTEMANEYYVDIEEFRDGFDARVIRYRYEKPGASIYHTTFTQGEIQQIKAALDILSRFEGMPQMEWIRDLCARFDVFISSTDLPVVEFEETDSVFGREFFTGLFHAIISKRPIYLNYKRFGKKARTHLLYPYFLKQFDRRWYLVAKNAHHLDSIASYALDRMNSFEVSLLDEYVPLDINVHDYFNDVYGIARMDEPVQTIRFHVEKKELPYLQTSPIHHSQKIVGKDKNGVFMTIDVIPNTELLMKLMSYGDGLTVITKGKLRSDIKKKLRTSLKNYGSST